MARSPAGLLILSVLAAVLTAVIKGVAFYLTGSVGLLSDALESGVNLAAALFAFFALRYASRPADLGHTYGHRKIEYFSSGLEGVLILVAAAGIAWTAASRLFAPEALRPLGVGLLLSLLAAAINGGVALLLLRGAKTHDSIVLEADGHHLLTDVWTSVAVVSGLAVVWATGLEILDPLIALAVAGWIAVTAVGLLRRSFDGLMDHALPESEISLLRNAITPLLGPDMDFHALRTRRAGSQRFVDFHLLVPGAMTVAEAHERGDAIGEALKLAVPGIEVTCHVEPIEDDRSRQDSELLALEARLRG